MGPSSVGGDKGRVDNAAQLSAHAAASRVYAHGYPKAGSYFWACALALTLDKGQKVGVDDIGIDGAHAMAKLFIDLKRAIFQKFG